MASISVCMIVKNEEKNLGPCLDCLKEIADEIVIVDTGSQDSTMEIAAGYTDRLFSFPWTGNFSEARNFAFSKASMEYVYSADADERIDQENQIKFKLLKNALLPEVEIVQMRYANQLERGGVYNFDQEPRPKLFRRLRSFRWVYPIHETVALEPVVFDSEIVIGHFPAERHASRDLAAFAGAAARERLDKRLHHMYAMELFIAGEDDDFLRAEAVFRATLEDEARGYDEMCEARAVAARAARLRKEEALFFKTILQGLVGSPSAELCCEIGAFYFDRADYEEAAVWYHTAAGGAQSILDVHTSGDLPLLCLARCYEVMGDETEACFCRARAASWTPEQSIDGR